MTDLTDQQIEALDAAATPGPWESCDASGEWFTHPPATGSFLVNDGRTHEQKRADAKFIAASRSLVPSLLAAKKEAVARAQKAEADAAHLRLSLRAESDELTRAAADRDEWRNTAYAAKAHYEQSDDRLVSEAGRADALAARLASAEAKLRQQIADKIEACPTGASGATHVAVAFFRRSAAAIARGQLPL